jgi:Restriction endonuclease
MSSLNFTDRKQLERLYGMGGGTVLDFSNRTLQEFIFETTGADIYSTQFDRNSGSKAHRLRAYWELGPDRDVGKLILAFCQYQREFCFGGVDQELWSSCVSIGTRLCGKITHEPQGQTANSASSTEHNPVPVPTATSRDKATSGEFDRLLRLFDEMAQSNDPHRRGYQLQDLLNGVFAAAGISMVRAFTRNSGGEQIDGAFKFEGWHYIVECRWREKLADIRELDGLQGQVQRSGKQTMGVFLSINGWSSNVPVLLKQNRDKGIFLIDGYDLRCVLAREIELADLLNRKLAHLNIEAEPFLSAAAARTAG